MTRDFLERDDPRVSFLARQLEITMVQAAWIEDDVLFIRDPYDTYEVPTPNATAERSSTLPHSGPTAPAFLHGGSAHPPASGTPRSAEPEPPLPNTEPPGPDATREASGLDDYTAIDGVGPAYAQDLHDAGLYTYQDLRDHRDELGDIVPRHTATKICAWLDQRLV